MKHLAYFVAVSGLALGCTKAGDKAKNDDLQPAVIERPGQNASAAGANPHAGNPHAGNPHAGNPHAGAPIGAAPAGGTITGSVTETMNSGGYTYVLVNGAWAAAPETNISVGDVVSFSQGMPMEQFHSKTLNRTFDVVYFVQGFTVQGAAGGSAAPAKPAKPAGDHPSSDHPTAETTVAKLPKPDGGHAIEELFSQRAALANKKVSVRGKVVKYNGGILGKNWLHLQDGSGGPGTNDITVTSAQEAALGDTVVVTGTLGLNKDFGGGYSYEVIIEEATILKE